MICAALMVLVGAVPVSAATKETKSVSLILTETNVSDGEPYSVKVRCSGANVTGIETSGKASISNDITITVRLEANSGYKFSKNVKAKTNKGRIGSSSFKGRTGTVKIKYRGAMTLKKPVNVRIEQYIAKWDAVDKASGYRLELKGSTNQKIEAKKSGVDLRPYVTDFEKGLCFRVMALSSKGRENVHDSGWSNWTGYVYPKEDNSTSGIISGQGENIRYKEYIGDGEYEYVHDCWQNVNGLWYYFKDNGRAATGFCSVDAETYYFDKNGIMQTGWQKIGEAWYYFRNSGEMVRDEWVQDRPGGPWYYLTETGRMARNTVTPDGYRVGDDGAML